MDFVFAAYPWLIMWKLDMKKSEKIGLCVVMSLVCLPPPPFPFPQTHELTLNNRAWSSQSNPPSAHTGNTKATKKMNTTSGASACRPSGTPPKLPALSSCNVFQCYGRWSTMFAQHSLRQRGCNLRRTSSWKPQGQRSNGIMRNKDFLCLSVLHEDGVWGERGTGRNKLPSLIVRHCVHAAFLFVWY